MPTTINGDTGVSKVQPSVVSADSLVESAAAPVQRMLLTPVKAYNWNSLTTNTYIDFINGQDGVVIPSWAKKISVLLNGVSTTGAELLIQLGTSGGIQTTGYLGSAGLQSTAPATNASQYTTGFGVKLGGATYNTYGQEVLTLIDAVAGTWVAAGAFGYTAAYLATSGGDKSLAGMLDRIRITTVNGTDVFDAGSISLLIEGYK